MAKPLDARISSALSNDDVTVTDLSNLIAETREARQRQIVAAETADKDATDIALVETDRDAAATKAERSRRGAQTYTEAIDLLEAKLGAKRADAKRAEAEAEKEAALAERDQIAERFGEIMSGLTDTMISLFGDVQANEARLRAAGLGREQNAEALARGVPQNWSDKNYAEIAQYSKMQIPAWSASGRAWPKRDKLMDPLLDWTTQQRKIEREVKERAAEREAKTWGWYRLTSTKGVRCPSFGARVVLENRGPMEQTKQRGLWKETWSGGLRRAEAEQLRSLGLNIEEIDRDTAEREQREREMADD